MDRLMTLEEDNPGLVNLYSIGQSVEERNLTVIQITRQKVFQHMVNKTNNPQNRNTDPLLKEHMPIIVEF